MVSDGGGKRRTEKTDVGNMHVSEARGCSLLLRLLEVTCVKCRASKMPRKEI